ncbi:MAG TPA: S9 family peptidase, partial [Telluria sp.]|nr:S9 family peptidase [Telluria sp.]
MLFRLLAALALLTITSVRAADAPPIAAFFDTPAFTGAKLSPTGKFLAVRIGVNNGRERLAVVDLATNKIDVVAHFSNADVDHFMWVNDERLVFDTRDREAAEGDWRAWPGMWAVNRDGTRFRQLVEITKAFVRDATTVGRLLPANTFLLNQQGAQDSEYVYAVRPLYNRYEITHQELVRINTLNGRESLVTAPGKVTQWMLDAKGEPRLALGIEKNKVHVWYREAGQEEAWRELLSYDAYVDEKLSPVGFAPDGSLYVAARRNEDKSALYKMDLAHAALAGQPLLKIAQFDFNGSLVNHAGHLAGIRYLGDAPGTAWLDPKLKALQDTVDALLPATTNMISLPARAETPWVLVVAESDVQPPVYLLFNTETKAFNRVGEMRPAIHSKEMGQRSFVHVQARDGLDIPAW